LRISWKGSVVRRGLHSWDAVNLRYLIYLSNKHEIDPYDLLNGFVEAEKKNTVTCGPLKIVLRERAKNHAIFLLTRESKIVAQMGMKSEVWENPSETKRLYSFLLDRSPPFKKPEKPPSSIKELRKGMKNVDLKVKVAEKSEVMLRYSRYNSSPVLLCVATVTDFSGSIRLPLWDDQIDVVSVGDEIEIKNASVKTFQGLLQIIPTRKRGELVVVEPSAR